MTNILVNINNRGFRVCENEEKVLDDMIDLFDAEWEEEYIRRLMRLTGYGRLGAYQSHLWNIMEQIKHRKNSVIEIGGVILQFKE